MLAIKNPIPHQETTHQNFSKDASPSKNYQNLESKIRILIYPCDFLKPWFIVGDTFFDVKCQGDILQISTFVNFQKSLQTKKKKEAKFPLIPPVFAKKNGLASAV